MKTQLELWNKLSEDSALKEIQNYIRAVIEIRGFSNQEVEKTMLLLIEEVGELAKSIRKNATNMSIDNERISHYDTIENEVADVFIVLNSVCNKLNIDLFKALKDKEKENITRNWNEANDSTKVKNKVLITGAVLSSDNSSVDTYESIISLIDTSKYAVSSPLDTMKFKGNDVERYEIAMNLLKDTKMIIAEMSSVSTGQGMELQEAVNLGIPILVVAKEGSKISGLVKGCKNVKDIIYYKEINDIKDKILKFIEEEK